jgi:hypothetical protein
VAESIFADQAVDVRALKDVRAKNGYRRGEARK